MDRKLLPFAIVALAACNDPTSPKNPEKPQEQEATQLLVSSRTNLVRGPNFESYTDFYVPQQYGPNPQTPAQYCVSQLVLQAATWSDQTQKLVWNDYQIISNPQNRYASGVVLSGRQRIKFRGYVGTYSGQPIQCVRVEELYMDRTNNMPRPTGYTDQPALFAISTPPGGINNWGFCFGSSCATNPAHLHVESTTTWKRWCNIDVWPSQNCWMPINLGLIIMPFQNDPTFMTDGQWDVEVRANGYWTAWNYGGNTLREFGFCYCGQTGYYLNRSYYYAATTGYIQNVDGQSHWVLN